MPRGRFYLGRIIKLGQLDTEKLIDAILDSPTVAIGKFAWAITDIVNGMGEDNAYVYGHLSKFSVSGQIKVVDTDNKAQVETTAENLLIASSPFVYLPEFSGIAYLHVWNGIQEEVFPRRFKKIIESRYDDFFVDCSIEPVADYREFALRLSEMNSFSEIHAKVHPPNPLFGRLWKSLRQYIERRNASELNIKESAESEGGLESSVANYMTGIMSDSAYVPDEEPDITDLALLMAADGYGSGKVVGDVGGHEVIVKTSETKKSFLYPKAPAPAELADQTREQFRRISIDRDMEHP